MLYLGSASDSQCIALVTLLDRGSAGLVALGAFEISALVVSRLSWKEQRNSNEDRLQRTVMEQLYELSRSTLLINVHQPPGRQIARLIHRIFGLEAVALLNAESATTDTSGIWIDPGAALVRDCFVMLAGAHAGQLLEFAERKANHRRAGLRPIDDLKRSIFGEGR